MEVIKTERLVLKAIEDQDEKDLLLLVNDPLIKKTYMLPDLLDAKSASIFFKKMKDLCYSDKHIAYGIYFNNKIIGFINSVFIEGKTIEIGYFIDSRLWNNGFATEALGNMIDILYKKGFEEILAAHFEENPASGRVMQKCGMHQIDKTESINYRGVDHRCIYYQINKKERSLMRRKEKTIKKR